MSRQWRTRQTLGALAAPLATAALVTTPGTAATPAAGAQAPPCQSWTSTLPPSPGAAENDLFGVSALSPCDVWAVGTYRAVATGPLLSLAEHWNGTAWKVVPTPNPGTSTNFLRALSAFSASNVWAVGHADDSTLILHWNGTNWARVPSPSPGPSNDLSGVRAVSATSAWAVGQAFDSTSAKTLILRWNGTNWSQVASPTPGNSGMLDAVTATSAGNAWGVGGFFTGTAGKTLILHWNGAKWAQVASPNPFRPGDRDDPGRGGRHLGQQRLGGGHLQHRHQREDLHRALERHRLETSAQPQPWQHWQLSPRRDSHLCQQRLGGG
jgi:hypothetical protein